MDQPWLPYARATLADEDTQALASVIASEWVGPGPEVERFEAEFAARIGVQFAVAMSSGTAALHAAAHAVGVGAGDHVIVPTLTFCSTANVILFQGASPLLADVDAETLCLDPDDVASRITPETRAIVPVHYGGHPCDMDALCAIARERGIAVIEDATHAPGARYRDCAVGTLGDVACFSFHPAKHLTTGEGGIATTNDPQIAKRLQTFRNHGISADAQQRDHADAYSYEMVELGLNYRMSGLSAALGRAQLARLDAFLERRRELVHRLTKGLSGIVGVGLPVVRPDVEPAWHLFWIRTQERDELYHLLRNRGLGVNVHYRPVHQQPYYRARFGDRDGAFPNAEAAFRELLTLPLFPGMSDADADRVIHEVRNAVQITRAGSTGPALPLEVASCRASS